MPLDTGWPEDQRLAFEAELQQVVQSVKDDSEAPRWHVLCEIDRGQPRPPKQNGAWKEYVREALLSENAPGRLQLMAEGERVGDGVVVEYFPASNDGSLPFANQGGAYFVVGSASTRILEEVHAKALKVRQSERAQGYLCWWLVLDDEVVIVHGALRLKSGGTFGMPSRLASTLTSGTRSSSSAGAPANAPPCTRGRARRNLAKGRDWDSDRVKRPFERPFDASDAYLETRPLRGARTALRWWSNPALPALRHRPGRSVHGSVRPGTAACQRVKPGNNTCAKRVGTALDVRIAG